MCETIGREFEDLDQLWDESNATDIESFPFTSDDLMMLFDIPESDRDSNATEGSPSDSSVKPFMSESDLGIAFSSSFSVLSNSKTPLNFSGKRPILPLISPELAPISIEHHSNKLKRSKDVDLPDLKRIRREERLARNRASAERSRQKRRGQLALAEETANTAKIELQKVLLERDEALKEAVTLRAECNALREVNSVLRELLLQMSRGVKSVAQSGGGNGLVMGGMALAICCSWFGFCKKEDIEMTLENNSAGGKVLLLSQKVSIQDSVAVEPASSSIQFVVLSCIILLLLATFTISKSLKRRKDFRSILPVIWTRSSPL